MLSQQDEDHRQSTVHRSISPRVTPLTNDHVHIQHRNFNDSAACDEQTRQLGDASINDDIIYGRSSDEMPNSTAMCAQSRNANTHIHTLRQLGGNFVTSRSESKGNCVNDQSCSKCKPVGYGKRMLESDSAQKRRATQELSNTQHAKHGDSTHWRNVISPSKQDFHNHNRSYEHNAHAQSSNHENCKMHDYLPPRDIGSLIEDFKAVPKRLVRNDGNLNASIKP